MKIYNAIGVMSGTSLDGIDICYVELDSLKNKYKIIEAETIEYEECWKRRLAQAIELSGESLTKLDIEFGHFIGEQILQFIEKNQIQTVDFIASHGHTVFHRPNSGYTLQIGHGSAIWTKTNIPTIYDFRTQDVILGGQGAPLVPIGDQMLFSNYDACLNLGGFSNISFERNKKRIAFDICPVNIVLNQLSSRMNKNFDENGKMARSGKIDDTFLELLNQLEFYALNSAKSLGVEWCKENIDPLLHQFDLSTEDLLATFTENIAIQISEVLNRNEIKNVLITGGGAYNEFLIQCIDKKSKTKLILGDPVLIEYKEALIFAWMGMLRMERRINVLSSVTSASRDHSSGILIN